MHAEPYINEADLQLGYMSPAHTPIDLLAVRFFSNIANYRKGDHILHEGHLYVAIADITAAMPNGSPFDPTQWSRHLGSDPVHPENECMLSICDYNEKAGYAQGSTVFHDHQFWKATQAIPMPAGPFNPNFWENNGSNGGSGIMVGEVIWTFHQYSPTEQHDLRRLLLWGQEVPSLGEYAELFKLWGHSFGVPSVPQNFVVPDTRGRTFRGVDESLTIDVDGSSRFSLTPGSAANTGATGGTYQNDEVGAHKHTFFLHHAENDHTGPLHGYVTNNKRYSWWPKQVTHDYGGHETRMKNISGYWYVKY
jgi:hypothetical protein